MFHSWANQYSPGRHSNTSSAYVQHLRSPEVWKKRKGFSKKFGLITIVCDSICPWGGHARRKLSFFLFSNPNPDPNLHNRHKYKCGWHWKCTTRTKKQVSTQLCSKCEDAAQTRLNIEKKGQQKNKPLKTSLYEPLFFFCILDWGG